MQQLIGAISHSVPTVLREVIALGRTLKTASRPRCYGSWAVGSHEVLYPFISAEQNGRLIKGSC